MKTTVLALVSLEWLPTVDKPPEIFKLTHVAVIDIT